MKQPLKRYAYNDIAHDYFGKYMGHYKLETLAVSEAQAKSRICFQIKKMLGLQANAFVHLVGRVYRIDEPVEEIEQKKTPVYHQITIEEYLKEVGC